MIKRRGLRVTSRRRLLRRERNVERKCRASRRQREPLCRNRYGGSLRRAAIAALSAHHACATVCVRRSFLRDRRDRFLPVFAPDPASSGGEDSLATFYMSALTLLRFSGGFGFCPVACPLGNVGDEDTQGRA